MSLSCSCGDGDYDWYYIDPDDYSILNRKKRTSCCSCKKLIELQSVCVEFDRFKINEYGDEVNLASKFMCEECGDLYFSLDDLGFCINLGDNMHELVKEYRDNYATNPTLSEKKG